MEEETMTAPRRHGRRTAAATVTSLVVVLVVVVPVLLVRTWYGDTVNTIDYGDTAPLLLHRLTTRRRRRRRRRQLRRAQDSNNYIGEEEGERRRRSDVDGEIWGTSAAAADVPPMVVDNLVEVGEMVGDTMMATADVRPTPSPAATFLSTPMYGLSDEGEGGQGGGMMELQHSMRRLRPLMRQTQTGRRRKHNDDKEDTSSSSLIVSSMLSSLPSEVSSVNRLSESPNVEEEYEDGDEEREEPSPAEEEEEEEETILSHKLTTEFDGTRRGYGCMFDLSIPTTSYTSNVTSVSLDSMDMHLDTTNSYVHVQVYTTKSGGSYKGNELLSDEWTLIADYQPDARGEMLTGVESLVTGGGKGYPTPIPPRLFDSTTTTTTTLQILPGQTVGVYVTVTGGPFMLYTDPGDDDVPEGDTLVSDRYLTVSKGVGIEYPFGPDFFTYRMFNGVIRYTVNPSPVYKPNWDVFRLDSPSQGGGGGDAVGVVVGQRSSSRGMIFAVSMRNDDVDNGEGGTNNNELMIHGLDLLVEGPANPRTTQSYVRVAVYRQSGLYAETRADVVLTSPWTEVSNEFVTLVEIDDDDNGGAAAATATSSLSGGGGQRRSDYRAVISPFVSPIRLSSGNTVSFYVTITDEGGGDPSSDGDGGGVDETSILESSQYRLVHTAIGGDGGGVGGSSKEVGDVDVENDDLDLLLGSAVNDGFFAQNPAAKAEEGAAMFHGSLRYSKPVVAEEVEEDPGFPPRENGTSPSTPSNTTENAQGGLGGGGGAESTPSPLPNEEGSTVAAPTLAPTGAGEGVVVPESSSLAPTAPSLPSPTLSPTPMPIFSAYPTSSVQREMFTAEKELTTGYDYANEKFSHGNVFDVRAKVDLLVKTLSIRLFFPSMNLTEFNVVVYSKDGSYRNGIADASKWILRCQIDNKVLTLGKERGPTYIPKEYFQDIQLDEGTTHSFLVLVSEPNVIYSPLPENFDPSAFADNASSADVTSGTIFKSNDDMDIYVGAGVGKFNYNVSSQDDYDELFQDRLWHGTVHYNTEQTPSPTMAPSPTPSTMEPTLYPTAVPSTASPTHAPFVPNVPKAVTSQQKITLGGVGRRLRRRLQQECSGGTLGSTETRRAFEVTMKDFLRSTVPNDVNVNGVTVTCPDDSEIEGDAADDGGGAEDLTDGRPGDKDDDEDGETSGEDTDDGEITAEEDGEGGGALDIYTTINGDYTPPPFVDFNKIVEKSFEDEGDVFVEELKKADPVFEEATSVEARSVSFPIPPTPAPTPQPVIEPETDIVLIAMLAVAGVALFALIGLCVYFYMRRRKKAKAQNELLKHSPYGVAGRGYDPMLDGPKKFGRGGSGSGEKNVHTVGFTADGDEYHPNYDDAHTGSHVLEAPTQWAPMGMGFQSGTDADDESEKGKRRSKGHQTRREQLGRVGSEHVGYVASNRRLGGSGRDTASNRRLEGSGLVSGTIGGLPQHYQGDSAHLEEESKLPLDEEDYLGGNTTSASEDAPFLHPKMKPPKSRKKKNYSGPRTFPKSSPPASKQARSQDAPGGVSSSSDEMSPSEPVAMSSQFAGGGPVQPVSVTHTEYMPHASLARPMSETSTQVVSTSSENEAGLEGNTTESSTSNYGTSGTSGYSSSETSGEISDGVKWGFPLVTEVRTRPRTDPKDVEELFYTRPPKGSKKKKKKKKKKKRKDKSGEGSKGDRQSKEEKSSTGGTSQAVTEKKGQAESNDRKAAASRESTAATQDRSASREEVDEPCEEGPELPVADPSRANSDVARSLSPSPPLFPPPPYPGDHVGGASREGGHSPTGSADSEEP